MAISLSRVSSSSGAWFSAIALAAFAITVVACGGSKPSPAGETAHAPATTSQPAGGPAGEDDVPLPLAAHELALPDNVRSMVAAPFAGDFDEMVKRRLIRVGVTYNRTFYFADKGVQRGVAYEFGKAFEDWINKKLSTGDAKISVAMVPMPRDALGKALLDGRVDLVIAQPMEKLDKGLFTFASYNAGPARIWQLRREAAKRGLDPNVWFGNVEQIASERIGRETVTYVSNIYKYYVAYRLLADERARRDAAKADVASGGKQRVPRCSAVTRRR